MSSHTPVAGADAGTVIVTGAAGGLGFGIAETMLGRSEPYTYLFTVRDAAAPNAQRLHDLVGSHTNEPKAAVLGVELGSLASIRAFAGSINARVAAGALPPIRALVLNAGVQFRVGGLRRGDHGFEMHFAVNYLANFLLVLLLLRSMDRARGRIVYISSWTHDSSFPINQVYRPEKLQWKDPEELARPSRGDEPGDELNGGHRRYGASKLWLVMFMHALQKRLDGVSALKEICVVGVDPGGMLDTDITRNGPLLEKALMYPLIRAYTRVAQYIWPNGAWRTVRKSAGDVTRAALAVDDPDLGEFPKDAYLDGSVRAETAVESQDEEKQKMLWEASLRFAELDEKETALG